MKTKFTPGPWEVCEANDKTYVLDEEGQTVAVAGGGYTLDEERANARLIAEAPAMLAALQAFVDPWGRGGDWQSKITYETYNNARKIIAKAEGGAV